MPLSKQQVKILADAIKGYAFPAVYYDFHNDKEIVTKNMAEVENRIRSQLRSSEIISVKYGLANVLYWGFATMGFRNKRVREFLNRVRVDQLMAFQSLLTNSEMPTLMEIKKIKMPQYSGISFISKILMFLNPESYCVLDAQIAKLRTGIGQSKSLDRLNFRKNEKQIRITTVNEEVYNQWRNECLVLSHNYYCGSYRSVDVERGFYFLIIKGKLPDAQRIYYDA